MSTITKDDVLAIVKQHTFILVEEQQTELDALAESYLPIAKGVLNDYMVNNNLCYQENEDGDNTHSKKMALACVLSIVYSAERDRKSKKGMSLVSNSRQIKSESVGSYSHSFDNAMTKMLENSPISIFLKGSLIRCPDVVAIHNISTPCGGGP